MMTYQDRRGAIEIDGQTSTTTRVQDTSLIFPSSTETIFVTRFRQVSSLSASLDFLFRISTTSTPPLAIRNKATTGDYLVYIDSTVAGGGRPTLNIGSLTDGVDYAIVIHHVPAGLSQVDHPGSTSGDFIICYLYDLSTRSPTATIFTSSTANFGFALDSGTGVEWRSTNGQTNYLVSDTALYYATSGSSGFNSTMADQYGKFTLNTAKIGIAWKHLWNLHHYSTATVATTPAGDEAFMLNDQGVGDGTSTRDLRKSGTPSPVWSQTNLTQALGSSEDTVQAMSFASIAGDNLALARQSFETDSKGTILVCDGDSFGRIDLSPRYPQAFIE